jgi:Zn-dependent protease with chaperone function
MDYNRRKRLVWLGRQRSHLYSLIAFCAVLLFGGLLAYLSLTGTGSEIGLGTMTRILIAACVVAGCAALAWQASVIVQRRGDMLLELLDTTPRPGPLQLDKAEDAVSGIAIASGMPRPGVSVVDDDCLNAFTVPLGGGKARLCLTSGLIETLSREELTGVVSHEYAHIKDGDLDRFHVTLPLLWLLWKKRSREGRWLALARGLLLPLLWVATTVTIVVALLVNNHGDNALMLLLTAAYVVASLVFCLFLLYPESFSQETLDERFSVDLVADRDALGWTFNPVALESALRKCHAAGTSPALALVNRVSFVCTSSEVGYLVSVLWTSGAGCTYYSRDGSVLGNQWEFAGNSRRFRRDPPDITPQQASVEHRLYSLENLWSDSQPIQPIPIR